MQEAHSEYQVCCGLRWTISFSNCSWGQDMAGAASFPQNKNRGLATRIHVEGRNVWKSFHITGKVAGEIWRPLEQISALLLRVRLQVLWTGFFKSLLNSHQFVSSSHGSSHKRYQLLCSHTGRLIPILSVLSGYSEIRLYKTHQYNNSLFLIHAQF